MSDTESFLSKDPRSWPHLTILGLAISMQSLVLALMNILEFWLRLDRLPSGQSEVLT